MRLSKHAGLGNDFLIALVDQVPSYGSALAQRVCERHTGVGADGLIFGVRPAAPDGDFRFVLFNADGSRPEVSGNGLRCLGQAIAMDQGLDDLVITVGTDAGPRQMTVAQGLSATAMATVDMGPALPGPDTDPIANTTAVPALRIGSVDMGNPHIVIQVDEPRSFDMATVGPAIESHYLPTGTNVHLIAPGSTSSALDMAIWERGAGVTEACGSGACAAASVAVEWGLCDDTVDVAMPGGAATVAVADTIELTGPADYIATIDIPEQTVAQAAVESDGSNTEVTHG